MNVKAIETIYKGRRFRSRLEARWAVVFEHMGYKWSYEVEGYEVNGKRYLPDFVIETERGGKFTVEIKNSLHFMGQPASVYMAGRMEGLAQAWRPSEGRSSYVFGHERVPDVYTVVGGKAVKYTGPFWGDARKHSVAHSIDFVMYDEDAQRDVFNRSMAGIDAADIVLCMIEDRECYGTLVEIGYARAKGKKVFIAYVFEDGSKDAYDLNSEDLWFSEAASTKSKYFMSAKEAVDWLHSNIPVRCIAPAGYENLSQVAKATGSAPLMLIGSPGDHVVFGRGPDFEEGALLRGLQARFEHGEKP